MPKRCPCCGYTELSSSEFQEILKSTDVGPSVEKVYRDVETRRLQPDAFDPAKFPYDDMFRLFFVGEPFGLRVRDLGDYGHVLRDGDVLVGFLATEDVAFDVVASASGATMGRFDIKKGGFEYAHHGHLLALIALQREAVIVRPASVSRKVRCVYANFGDNVRRRLACSRIEMPAAPVGAAIENGYWSRDDESPMLYSTRIAPWYESNAAQVGVYKKELMARTWHPSRHAEWCLDADERRELFDEREFVGSRVFCRAVGNRVTF